MIFRRKKAEEPVLSDAEAPEPVESPEPSPNGSGPALVHAEGLRPPDDGPASVSRPTRKRLPLWDRVKYLILLTLLWFLLVWAAMGDDPLLPFGDACRETARSASWVFILAGIELLRQAHFLVSERWSRYHNFWINRFFGGIERQSHRRLSAWTRFRIARVVKWAFWITVIAFVFGKVQGTGPIQAMYELPAAIWGAMPFIIQMSFYIAFGILQFAAIFWFLSRGGVDVYYPDDIKTRFTDVWGQDHVVERVQENIVFLENPEDIEDKGGYVPGGILLWGPPGTGKTLMAEAVAGETGKPYVFVDPGAFINMFMGVGVLKVKALFRKVRKLSLRYGGVIVFFDEADSLGRRGGIAGGGPAGQPGFTAPFSHTCHGSSYLSKDTQWSMARNAMAPSVTGPGSGETSKMFYGGGGAGGGGDMGTLQSLLTEMSGLKKPRGFVNRVVRRALGMRPKPPPKYRILIMMATNLPNALDEALLRPGRIDRIYKVGYPSKAGRIRTYKGYFDKVAHELTDEDMDKLATVTPYATGATIKDLVNESLITAIRDGREVITWTDVMRAKRLKQLGPPEDVEYIERERHAVAVHEACHAVMAYRTRKHLEIDIATIEKGSDYLGMVASIKPEDQFTRWRTEYEADILVSLASLAGERMFFGEDNSSGVSGDLESATMVAALMEAYWGMGTGISSLTALQSLGIGPGKPEQRGGGGGGMGFGATPVKAPDPVAGALGARIEKLLAKMLERAEEILTESRREVLALAHALETHKTLTGDDVLAVIDARQGPIIDGTIYQDADFARDLELYHQAAVAAHQGHTHVSLTLPAVQSTPQIEEPATA